jgi:putative flippase GtrA
MRIKKEIIRYSIGMPLIGGLDFGLYFLLNKFLPYNAAKAISYILANLAGYVLSKYWTFECKRPSYPEAGRYIASELFLFGCNVATNFAIRHFWPDAVTASVVIASIITAVLSFIVKRCWVFKTHLSD